MVGELNWLYCALFYTDIRNAPPPFSFAIQCDKIDSTSYNYENFKKEVIPRSNIHSSHNNMMDNKT
jgi:hypothetical protein